MSHPSVITFFSEVLLALKERLPANPSVCEIGSYDVNGSVRVAVQSAVTPAQYLGIDLTPGPGVDVVCSGHQFDSPKPFDLTISAECLEHNPHYEDTLRNLRRLTSPVGYTIISCATTGRLEHGTTRTNPDSSPGTQAHGWNYYKNLVKDDFPDDFLTSYDDFLFLENSYFCDLYFVGSVTGLLPENLKQDLACTHIRPKSTLANKLTLVFPLWLIRQFSSEVSYQDLGVGYLRVLNRAKRFFGLQK